MSDLHAAIGSYALNALDTAELAKFEAHLATCETCQDEIGDIRETAAELSLLRPATPPSALRNNVLAAIRTTAQVAVLGEAASSAALVITNGTRPSAELRRAVRSSSPRRAAPEPEVPERAEPEPHIDELTLRRQRRHTRVLSSLVAALLALAVGLGGVVYTLVQQRQAQTAQITLEEQLYSAPDATTSTTTLPDGGQVTFIASKQLNRALFLGTHLPDPGQNRYQLWTGTGNPTVQNEITGVTRDNQIAETVSGVKVFFGGNIAGADFLAVNLEPAGSTPAAPTNPVLAAGPVAV